MEGGGEGGEGWRKFNFSFLALLLEGYFLKLKSTCRKKST